VQNERAPQVCPCGSLQPYPVCCGRWHDELRVSGRVAAPTAELLMRSRYSAFAVGDEAYLSATWHPSTRPARLRVDPQQRWTGLQIRSVTRGGPFDDTGAVAFEARFRLGRQEHVLTETSRFVRQDGRWSYLGPIAVDRTDRGAH
jgi:SEC-C motif-containing protein